MANGIKISERKVTLWHIIITNIIMIVMGTVGITLFYAQVGSHMGDEVVHVTLKEKKEIMNLAEKGFPFTLDDEILLQGLKGDMIDLKLDIKEIRDILRENNKK